ncbi:hypothetical protein ACHAW6_012920 [Cyclotella cf. meneghiniana]
MHYLQPDAPDTKAETEQNQMFSVSPHFTDQSQTFRLNEPLDLKILLIDNHDSYTYNLYQYLSTMTRYPVKVVMNDDFPSWDALLRNVSSQDSVRTSKELAISTLDYFDCIVISPGPGQPSHASDMGIVLDTIRKNSDVPILGVCLGHQALGYVYGCEVKLAPSGPVHGLMSSVYHNERDTERKCHLFNGIPQFFDVVRYHSLTVQFPETLDELDVEPIAWCNNDVSSVSDAKRKNTIKDSQTAFLSNASSAICMGLRHKNNPHYGVQFHPESIGTGSNGYRLIRNFCDFAFRYNEHRKLEVKTQATLNPQKSMNCVLHDTVVEPASFSNTSSIRSDTILSRSQNNDQKSDVSSEPYYQVIIHKIANEYEYGPSRLPTPEQVFEELYSCRQNSFWLDSSTGETRIRFGGLNRGTSDVETDREGCPIINNSRFSIMGTDDGPLSRKIEYFGREHSLERQGLYVTSGLGDSYDSTASREQDRSVVLDMNILEYLRTQLVERQEVVQKLKLVSFSDDPTRTGITLSTLHEFDDCDNVIPFEYRGGYVGYLGYEVRHDCSDGISASHGEVFQPERTNSNVPTAAFMFADRSLLYDHLLDEWYIIGLARGKCNRDLPATTDASVEKTITWIQHIATTIGSWSQHQSSPGVDQSTTTLNMIPDLKVEFTPNRSKEQYQTDIRRSHDEIRRGESYELCVTNQLTTDLKLRRLPLKKVHESPFGLYKLLRRRNPAPFSAFFSLFSKRDSAKTALDSSSPISAQISICCSSPERFLSMTRAHSQVSQSSSFEACDFIVESKPIKGTAARYTVLGINNKQQMDSVEKVDSEIAARLRESVKDRAENLMIVDLLRNDLGRICKVGSVHVPKLMHIESYATVHQMVSTVRGTVDGRITNAIDVIEACFPGGSMTGAPKQRTIEILHEIEQGVSRGPYSGCLGYISLNGCMDMNIVIRTAVLTPSDCNDKLTEAWKVSIGCGGAITALSNSNDEYEEMLLKSRAVRAAILEWLQTRS